MSIVLVRHGQTAGNHARIVQLPEIPLDDTGVQQAALVAPRLAALQPVHLMCSDLSRARMTAEPIARLTNLAPELEPLLQERNFGDWRGLPYSTFAEGHPFGADLAPPHGETWLSFHQRVARAWERVVERRRSLSGNLIVVTHGLVLRSLFERVVSNDGLAVPTSFDNSSVTIVEADSPYRARLINDTSHLLQRPSKVGAA